MLSMLQSVMSTNPYSWAIVGASLAVILLVGGIVWGVDACVKASCVLFLCNIGLVVGILLKKREIRRAQG